MQIKANQPERTDDLKAAVLWIHVLSGAVGIGACACLAIAVSALTAGSDEFRDFAIRGVPALNRVNVVVAATVAVTGVTRLVMMMAGGFVPSAMFIDVLLMKVALLAGMATALAGSIRAAAVLKADGGSGAESAPSARKVAMFSGLAAGLGGAAMMLGAWLVGS